MSVDTKGFLLSDCKDVMLITGLVSQALHGLIMQECKTVLGEAGMKRSEKAREMFAYPELILKPDTGMVQFTFTFHSKRRTMSMFFDCDCDRIAYGPHSVSMSLGCSGHSALFMKTALHALSLIGPVYFDHDDSDDVDFALLDERMPPVLGAVSLDYIRDWHFPNWVEYFDAGKVGTGNSFEEFFGAPEATVRDICAMADFTERWKAVGKLAAGVDATPTFLSEYHQEAIAEVALAQAEEEAA